MAESGSTRLSYLLVRSTNFSNHTRTAAGAHRACHACYHRCAGSCERLNRIANTGRPSRSNSLDNIDLANPAPWGMPRANADRIHNHMSQMWASGRRGNAHGRLPLLLWLQRMRWTAQTSAGRLLCVLLLRLDAMPADSGGKLLLLGRANFSKFYSNHPPWSTHASFGFYLCGFLQAGQRSGIGRSDNDFKYDRGSPENGTLDHNIGHRNWYWTRYWRAVWRLWFIAIRSKSYAWLGSVATILIILLSWKIARVLRTRGGGRFIAPEDRAQ